MSDRERIIYLKPRQVEAVYGISTDTLATKRCRGGGPRYVKAPNGRIHYRENDVVDWIEGVH